MFGLGQPGRPDQALLYLRENWAVLIAAAVFSTPVALKVRKWADARRPVLLDLGYALMLAVIFVVSASFIIKGTYNPFIYFNF